MKMEPTSKGVHKAAQITTKNLALYRIHFVARSVAS